MRARLEIVITVIIVTLLTGDEAITTLDSAASGFLAAFLADLARLDDSVQSASLTRSCQSVRRNHPSKDPDKF